MSKFFEALEREKGSAPIRLKTRAPVSEFDIKPVLGRDLVVFNNPASVAAEYFRFLRSVVTRPVDKAEVPKTIMVTSAEKGEGKTFVAANLAVSISQSVEEYVLLIDADLRNPCIHRLFGIHPSKEGLSTYLSSKAPLSDFLAKSPVEKLTVLCAGDSTQIPAELLSSEKMEKLLTEVGNRYRDRFVIIDSPPLQLTPEASVIANHVDAVLLVVRHGKTTRHAVRSAIEKIPENKFFGIIFNGHQKGEYGTYGAYPNGSGKRKKSSHK